MKYDYIIIGAGISGLYMGYRLIKSNPKLKITILENNKRIGGRAKVDMFYGTKVLSGAGVGRYKKDKRLLKILKELKIPIQTYTVKINSIGFRKINILKTVNQLKIKYRRNPIHITFKKFATKHLGLKKYNKFKLSAGYTDYENEDVYSVLYHYGMEDNFGGWKAFSVDWKKLYNELAKRIGTNKIKTSHEVVKIKREGDSFIVKTNNSKLFETKKIILASTINTVRKLLNNDIYNYIESQPFIRTYGKFSKKSSQLINEKLHTFSVVKGPLQKLIPMNKDKGIYMICYNDNENALALKSKLKNSKTNRNYFCMLIEKALGIQTELSMIGMRAYYWTEGTHYYKPLRNDMTIKKLIKQAQNPDENIYVVGELISSNQGWTEGCFESVDKIFEMV